MQTARDMAPQTGIAAICSALGLSRASFYREQKPAAVSKPQRDRHRALDEVERANVLAVLHEKRFADLAPAEVFYTLVEEGTYVGSLRTMYRVLKDNKEVRERRDQLRRPNYKKPELVATGPNQVWSWDITKLKSVEKWVYFYLYVILDIFSRYVVGWMIAEHENAKLAQRLIEETFTKQGVEPGTLVIHADRGSPMKANTTAQLLASLDIGRSHSRPHVSNDNPFSESQFKTLKYHPEFPDRFGCVVDALSFGRSFFPWYNNEHRHSGLLYLTPQQVHHGLADEALDQRHRTMMAAYEAHPERFVKGPPKRPRLPEAVWINPPTEKTDKDLAIGVGVPITSSVADDTPEVRGAPAIEMPDANAEREDASPRLRPCRPPTPAGAQAAPTKGGSLLLPN